MQQLYVKLLDLDYVIKFHVYRKPILPSYMLKVLI